MTIEEAEAETEEPPDMTDPTDLKEEIEEEAEAEEDMTHPETIKTDAKRDLTRIGMFARSSISRLSKENKGLFISKLISLEELRNRLNNILNL